VAGAQRDTRHALSNLSELAEVLPKCFHAFPLPCWTKSNARNPLLAVTGAAVSRASTHGIGLNCPRVVDSFFSPATML